MIKEYAETLPLRVILSKIRLKPLHKNITPLLYHSPFHKDRAPTLEVNEESNTWKDNHANVCGGPLELIQEFLKHQDQRCSMVDVLQWLEFNIGYPSLLESVTLPDYRAEDKKYIIKFKSDHISATNVRYLSYRRIPVQLAKKHLVEVGLVNKDTNKECLALGLVNEEGGHAIRSSFIKALVGIRTISVIGGRAKNTTGIHVFKDIYDYLSAVLIQKSKPFNNDAIILNSYSCLKEAANYIRSMRYCTIYTWFDNGETGHQVTKNFAAFCYALGNTTHQPKNDLYASAYDVNAWLIRQAEKAGQ